MTGALLAVSFVAFIVLLVLNWVLVVTDHDLGRPLGWIVAIGLTMLVLPGAAVMLKRRRATRVEPDLDDR